MADGDLDPSFGTDGKVTIEFDESALAGAVAVQGDGKVLVAGTTGQRHVVVRLNVDGSIDTGYGVEGRVFVELDERPSDRVAVAIQPDGMLLLAGKSGGSIALARLRPNGTLDPGFDEDGKALIPTDGGLGGSVGIVLQPDGKILVGAYSGGFAAVRLLADGKPDPSFGAGGKASIPFGDSLGGIALQPDGKVVLAGTLGRGAMGSRFAVARLGPDGALDPSFGDGGTLEIPPESDSFAAASVTAVAVQPDGKIVLAGRSGGFTFMAGVARLLPDGRLDKAFESDGWKRLSFGGISEAEAMLLRPDGRIVVAGSAVHDFGIARLNAAGLLDATFGDRGTAVVSFGTPGGLYSSHLGAVGIAVQPDGKLVAVGYAEFPDRKGVFALVRMFASTESTAPPGDRTPDDLPPSSRPNNPAPPAGAPGAPSSRPQAPGSLTPPPAPPPVGRPGAPGPTRDRRGAEAGEAPRVVGVASSRGGGLRVAIRFSLPMDPARMRNPGLYRVRAAGRDGRLGTRDDRPLRVASAEYDPATLSVSIRLAREPRPGEAIRLGLDSARARSDRGVSLNGDGDGRPGGPFSTSIP